MVDVPAALITHTGLIVASANPTLIPPNPAPPELLEALSAAEGASFAEISLGMTVARSNTIPWQLVCRWS
jgi:hypothetical protein